MMDFCKSVNLFFGWFQSHNRFKNSFCCISIDLHTAILHSFQYHFSHICRGLFIKAFVIIPCQSLFVFFHGNFLILVYKFADRIQRICHIGNTKSLRAGEVINSTALFCSKSALYTVIQHRSQERKRASFCMCHIDCIICIDHK